MKYVLSCVLRKKLMMLMVLIRNQFDMHTQNGDALGAEQPPGSPDPDEICQNLMEIIV